MIMKSLLLQISAKPITAILTAAPVVIIAPKVDIIDTCWILFYLACLDFITGIGASYFTWLKQPDKKDKWFFGKGEGFNSAKFKQCCFKIIAYAGTPWIVLQFERAFMIKPMVFPRVTEAQLDLTIILLLVFCIVELFSIFWENLPKCGVNIPQMITKFLSGIWKIVRTAKGPKEE